MKNQFLTLLLIFTVTYIFGQNNDRIYLRHNHNYSTTYSYAITEIIIHSDSTFTWKSYDVKNKKEWKNYKKYKPEISIGKIIYNGEFQTLTEYINGNETEINWNVKISNKKLNFYFPDKGGKLKKSVKYKRIYK